MLHIVEEFDWLTGQGEAPAAAATRLGVKVATVHDYRNRLLKEAS